jgi:hypothetical protein
MTQNLMSRTTEFKSQRTSKSLPNAIIHHQQPETQNQTQKLSKNHFEMLMAAINIGYSL